MNRTFPVFGRINQDYKFLGSGFFLNNDGFFATAGHLFARSSCEDFFIGIPEGDYYKLIPIDRKIYTYRKVHNDLDKMNRIERAKQKFNFGPTFKDIAIGKVAIKNTNAYNIKRNKPKIGEQLMSNFYQKSSICPERFTITDNKVPIDYISHITNPLIVHRNENARIPFQGEDFINDNCDLYNNCYEVLGHIKKGNSGGAVLNSTNEIVGMANGGSPINTEPKVLTGGRFLRKIANKLRKKILA